MFDSAHHKTLAAHQNYTEHTKHLLSALRLSRAVPSNIMQVRFVKAVAEGWRATHHFLSGPATRLEIHTTLLVAGRLNTQTHSPPPILHPEVWRLIFTLL